MKIIPFADPEWPEPDTRLIDDDAVSAPRLEDDALLAGWADWISCAGEACGAPRDYVAAPSAFSARLLPETGNVEWGEPLDDPLMAQFDSSLAAQSTGLSPTIGRCTSVQADRRSLSPTARLRLRNAPSGAFLKLSSSSPAAVVAAMGDGASAERARHSSRVRRYRQRATMNPRMQAHCYFYGVFPRWGNATTAFSLREENAICPVPGSRAGKGS